MVAHTLADTTNCTHHPYSLLFVPASTVLDANLLGGHDGIAAAAGGVEHTSSEATHNLDEVFLASVLVSFTVKASGSYFVTSY